LTATFNELTSESANKQAKKNLERTWDSFRIKRDCFRGFSTYFKNNFKKWNKVWQSEKRNKRKKQNMRALIQKFCEEEFKQASPDQILAMISPMTIILHSHRYQKGEDFAQGLDFSLIRNLIYSYSQEARENFMDDEMMPYFFNHFCLKGKTQLISKSQGKTMLYVLEVEDELTALQAETERALARAF
jgi:hypothetical protein